MKLKYALFILFLPIFASPAAARPVSYAGGWMLMSMNELDRNGVEVNYSPSAFYSVGAMHEYRRGEKYNLDAATLNILAKRWNMPSSQANIFIKSGLGAAYDDERTEPAAFTGVELDWENRRLFTLYETRFFTAGNIESFVKHTARVGIAPYVGDTGDIHTWVMLQADYEPGNDDDFSVTPMVRIFQGTNLVEAGYNLDGGILFNFTKQF